MNLRSDLDHQLRDLAEEVEEIEQTVNSLKRHQGDLSGIKKSLLSLTALVQQIANELLPPTTTLTAIKLLHTQNGDTMQGPITLNVGQSTTATVLGFNADGSPFTGTMPTASYTVSDPAQDSVTAGSANDATVTSLAAGSADFSVTLTTAEGIQLTDSTSITNVAVVPPQALSSIKLDFSTPTP